MMVFFVSLEWNMAQSASHSPLSAAENPKHLRFINELTDDVVPVDHTFDPQVVASSAPYEDIAVYTASGRQIHISAASHPVLFEAFWCPHCQRTLRLLSLHVRKPSELPWVVSMGYPSGTTVKEAARVSQKEMRAFGLTHATVYYSLSPQWRILVPQKFPTLVFPSKRHLLMLSGEHAWTVWREALRDR